MISIILKGFSLLAGFSIPILSGIFLWIDGLIYDFARLVLESFFEMISLSTNTNAYSEQIGYIISRIMLLSGIYALFKLAIMLINYIINPDSVSKSNSGTNYVKNIIIAVVLLATSSFIFEQLNNLQDIIIRNKVIERVIYGPDSIQANGTNTIRDDAKTFVNDVFLLFFPSTCAPDDTGGGCARYNTVRRGEAGISSLTGLELDSKFSYYPIISGIFGLLLVYYFISFTIEIAIRMLRLVVLQVLSPIPIIMSIDPKQSDRLKTYATTYINIYLQVFIRIITIYLAFVICGLIADSSGNVIYSSNIMMLDISFVTRVLLYVGIFQGAKELPKLVDQVFGSKIAAETSGKGFMSMLKGVVGGGVGLVGGGIAGGVAGAAAGGAGNIAQGILTGAASGVWNGAKARNAKDLISAAGATVGSVRGAYKGAGSVLEKGGIGLAAAAGVRNFFGGQGRDQREIAGYDKKIADINKSKENLNTAATRRNDIQNKLNEMYAKKSGYSSLEDYLNNSTSQQALDYRNWRSTYNEHANDAAYDPSNREDERIRMNEAKAVAEQAYNSELDSYSRSQFNIAELYLNNPSEMQAQGYALDDADLAKMISEYNSFVNEKGMGKDSGFDRTLDDYSQMKKYSSDDKKVLADHDREIANTQAQKDAKMNTRMYKASNPQSGSKN